MNKHWKQWMVSGAIVATLVGFMGCCTRTRIGDAPVVLTDPQSTNVPAGGRLMLTIAARGTMPLHYLWRHNGLPVTASTKETLVLPQFQRSDGGSYDVVVWNRFGTNQSQVAFVNDTTPATEPADSFEQPRPLNGVSGVLNSSNVGATRQSGEPKHADDDGGSSIWFNWKAPANGVATFDTKGSSFDTVLAVYSSKSYEGLAQSEVSSDDDSGPFFSSQVTFNAVAGRDYRIAVDGVEGAAGGVALNWKTDLRVENLPPNIIKRPPTRWIVSSDRSLRIEVIAAVPPGQKYTKLEYQWLKDDQRLKNATNSTYSIERARDNDAAVYKVLVRLGRESVTLRTVVYIAHTYSDLKAGVISGGTLTVPTGSLNKAPRGLCFQTTRATYSILPTNCFAPADTTRFVADTTNAANAGLDTFLRLFQRYPDVEMACNDNVATNNLLSQVTASLPTRGPDSYCKMELSVRNKPTASTNVTIRFEFTN